MSVAIEDASIRYVDKLYRIETECFEEEAFTKQQIAYLLTDYNSIGLVAKVKSEIVGFIIGKIHVERNSLTGHILTIDVSPIHHRKGIAHRLLQEIERILIEKNVKSCYLEVREDNIAALNLYQKSGYKKIGRLKNYYENVHGIYLRKTLT